MMQCHKALRKTLMNASERYVRLAKPHWDSISIRLIANKMNGLVHELFQVLMDNNQNFITFSCGPMLPDQRPAFPQHPTIKLLMCQIRGKSKPSGVPDQIIIPFHSETQSDLAGSDDQGVGGGRKANRHNLVPPLNYPGGGRGFERLLRLTPPADWAPDCHSPVGHKGGAEQRDKILYIPGKTIKAWL